MTANVTTGKAKAWITCVPIMDRFAQFFGTMIVEALERGERSWNC